MRPLRHCDTSHFHAAQDLHRDDVTERLTLWPHYSGSETTAGMIKCRILPERRRNGRAHAQTWLSVATGLGLLSPVGMQSTVAKSEPYPNPPESQTGLDNTFEQFQC